MRNQQRYNEELKEECEDIAGRFEGVARRIHNLYNMTDSDMKKELFELGNDVVDISEQLEELIIGDWDRVRGYNDL